jgi:hypothetical protein
MNREARKKMLIVQGMLHRAELMQVTQQIKDDVRPSHLISRLPELFALVTRSKALPLISTALTLLAGKSHVPRLLRRAMVVAGVASMLTVFVKRWKSRKAQTGNDTHQN